MKSSKKAQSNKEIYFSAIMYGRNFKGTYHMLLGGTEKKDYLPSKNHYINSHAQNTLKQFTVLHIKKNAKYIKGPKGI